MESYPSYLCFFLFLWSTWIFHINFFWYVTLKARWVFLYSASMWNQPSISIIRILFLIVPFFELFKFLFCFPVFCCCFCWGVDSLLVNVWCQAKLAKLRRELLTPSSKGAGGAGEGFDVTKSGDSRVGLVGFPSVGKSTLLNKLTGTFSEVWRYSRPIIYFFSVFGSFLKVNLI